VKDTAAGEWSYSWSQKFDQRATKDENLEYYPLDDEPFDPGGYWWPPTFSNWLKTALWQFWQFTIFSRF
jgi:hypothetical protein